MARHSLQRLAAPSPSFSLVVHALGIASFCYSFYFLYYWETPISVSYGSHFQFLTILGLSATCIGFVLALLSDLTLSQTLFQCKNAIHVLATPLEVVVSVLYWGLMLIDPSLLVPDDMRLPLSVDLSFHLAPAMFLVLDLLLFSPPWTIPAYGVMLLSTGLAFGYWYWIELCFSVNGWYPYPIFEMLNTTQRVLLFTFAASVSTASSFALKWVYGKVNGVEVSRREVYKPLKKVQ